MNDISISLNIPTLILFSITLLVIGVCLFLIGYFIGKQSVIGVSNVINNVKPTSFFNEESNKNKLLGIDDTKYVVDIKTSGMEKKYENLGEIKQSTENITDSINKLKNMKR